MARHTRAARPQDLTRPLFSLAGFFRVSLDGLSERGTARSLSIIVMRFCFRARTQSSVSIQTEPLRARNWYKASATKHKMIKISSATWQWDPSRDEEQISAGQSVGKVLHIIVVL